mgnify:CR=1 FL=1
MSTPQNYVRLARRDNLTLRQVAMRSAVAKDHWALIGTPATIADHLEQWFVEKAADGFNLLVGLAWRNDELFVKAAFVL